MVKLGLIVLLVVAIQWITTSHGYGEDFANGLPPYESRAYLVLLNALRIAPKQYIQKYAADYGHGITTIVLQNAAATNPLSVDQRLYYSAALLVNDVTSTQGCPTGQTLCNGTSYETRIRYYYNDCLSSGGRSLELISAGSFSAWADPRFTISAQLCANPTDKDNCTADNDTKSVYRAVMTGSTYATAGAARAPFTTNTQSGFSYFWSINMGSGCAPNPAGSSAINSGSHFIDSSGSLVFMAIFNSASSPDSASVVIDNSTTPTALTLSLGSATLGAYTFSRAKFTECHSYYFSFVAGGNTYRYPETGLLWTYDSQYCSTSFTGASNPSTTAGPTTGGSGTVTNTGPNTGVSGSGTSSVDGGGSSTQTTSPSSTQTTSGTNGGNGGSSSQTTSSITGTTSASPTSGAEHKTKLPMIVMIALSALFMMF